MAMMTVRGRAVLGTAMVARNGSARKRPGRNPGHQIRGIKSGASKREYQKPVVGSLRPRP
jgi:hypothetical protein